MSSESSSFLGLSFNPNDIQILNRKSSSDTIAQLFALSPVPLTSLKLHILRSSLATLPVHLSSLKQAFQ